MTLLSRYFIVVCLALFSSFVMSAQTVMVKELFKNAALLIIDNEQVLLKVGKIKAGVTLLEASSRDALLDIHGKRQRVGLSKQIGGSYKVPTKKEVRISSRDNGHHWVTGYINNGQVQFIVDTGATLIALNASTAKRLGIDVSKGQRGWSNTSNGRKEIRIVTLDKVTIGSITRYNIEASAGLDDSLPVALLGNSFLQHTNMKTENGVLVLTAK